MDNTAVLVSLMESVLAGNEQSDKIIEMLSDINNLFSVFDIMMQSPNENIRLFASVCINNRLFRDDEPIPPEYVPRIKELLIQAIENEPVTKNCYNISFIAIGILSKPLIPDDPWDEFIDFTFSLLSNPEKLHIGFNIAYQIKSSNYQLSDERLFAFSTAALENLQNEDPEVRIQAAYFVKESIIQFESLKIEGGPVQTLLLECSKHAFYELGDSEDALTEARAFALASSAAFDYSSLLNDGPLPIFYMEVMQDDNLPYDFRYTAANTVNDMQVPILEAKSLPELLQFLEMAIGATMYFAQQELEGKNFEILRDFIWDIAAIAETSQVLEAVLYFLEQLSEQPTDESRCVGLFLIDCIAEGSREFISPHLPNICATINSLGQSENPFIVNYACNVYQTLINELPELLPPVMNNILDYLGDFFTWEGAIPTFIALLTKIPYRPSQLGDVLQSLMDSLDETEDVDALDSLLFCIGACLSYPTEPNETYFENLAPTLLQTAEETEELIPSVLYLFSRLVYTSPASTVTDIETVAQLAIEAANTENPRQQYQALQLIDSLISFLPVAVQPHMQPIVELVFQLKEDLAQQIQQSDDEFRDDDVLSIPDVVILILGHLVQNFPADMEEYANDVLVTFREAVYPGGRPISAAKACCCACDGFVHMSVDTDITLFDIVKDIVVYLQKESHKWRIAEYYRFLTKFFQSFPQALEQELQFLPRLTSALEGQYSDFLLFELSTTINPFLLPSIFSLFFTLLELQYPFLENFQTAYLQSATPCIETCLRPISALANEGISIIIRTNGATDEEYASCFETAKQVVAQVHSPVAQEAYWSVLLNLFFAKKEGFCNDQMFKGLYEAMMKLCQRETTNLTNSNIIYAFVALFANIVTAYDVAEISPEAQMLLAERLSPPLDTSYIVDMAPYVCYGAEHWPDAFGPKLPMYAVRALACSNFYVQRMQEDALRVFLQQVQALEPDTQLALLNGDQGLFLKLTRNVQTIAEAMGSE